MRRFLLFLGSFMVGSAVLTVLLAILTNDPENPAPIGSIIAYLIFSLVIGLFLSGPFFLSPPERIGIWSFQAPVYVWLFVLMIRLVSGTGLLVLEGVWRLIYVVWTPSRRRGPIQYPSATQRPDLRPMPQYTPPSWQPDPTGRYGARYWNGAAWTEHVASGGQRATDPIGR